MSELIKAIKARSIQQIQEALEARTDINIQDEDGNTALHLAVIENKDHIIDLEMIKILLDAGSNINIQNKTGHSALTIAVQKNNVAITNLLLRSKKELQQEFFHSIRETNTEKIGKLLAAGADINGINLQGNAALHRLASKGLATNLRFLLSYPQIELNKTNKDNKTALHLAVIKGKSEIIVDLLNNKIDVNIQDKDGNTALHLAVLCCHVEIAIKLTKYGANTNLQNKDGNTALDLGQRLDDPFKNILTSYLQPLTQMHSYAAIVYNTRTKDQTWNNKYTSRELRSDKSAFEPYRREKNTQVENKASIKFLLR